MTNSCSERSYGGQGHLIGATQPGLGSEPSCPGSLALIFSIGSDQSIATKQIDKAILVASGVRPLGNMRETRLAEDGQTRQGEWGLEPGKPRSRLELMWPSYVTLVVVTIFHGSRRFWLSPGPARGPVSCGKLRYLGVWENGWRQPRWSPAL